MKWKEKVKCTMYRQEGKNLVFEDSMELEYETLMTIKNPYLQIQEQVKEMEDEYIHFATTIDGEMLFIKNDTKQV